MTKTAKKPFKSIDTISKDLDIVDNFVLKYWKKYVYIAIGVVVVVAAFSIFMGIYEHNKKVSARELTGAVTLEELQTAIKNNPSNPLTPYCKLEVVSKLIEKGDYETSASMCKDVIASQADPFVISRASIALALISQVRGNNQEALDILTKVDSNLSAPIQLKAESMYYMGMIYVAMGNKEQAADVLKRASAIPSDSCVGWQEFSRNLYNRIN